jgi:hypothetical protein
LRLASQPKRIAIICAAVVKVWRPRTIAERNSRCCAGWA